MRLGVHRKGPKEFILGLVSQQIYEVDVNFKHNVLLMVYPHRNLQGPDADSILIKNIR
jgi:hypothetical protein